MIDYTNNIISVTNSLLKHYHVKPHHNSLPLLDDLLQGKKHVIVMLLDGLGMNILNKIPKETFLRKHLKTTLSSVFPPTTVAATNAFLIGKTPFETGFVGWAQHNPFEDVTESVFLKKDFYGNKIIKRGLYESLFPEDFLTQIKKKNPDLHVESIFPKPIQQQTYETFDEQLDRLLMITKGKKSLSYCYYVEPDTTIHDEGIDSEETLKKVMELNEKIEQFYISLNKDVLVVILADHGLVDIEYLYVETYPDMLETFYRKPSIEPRAKAFFIKKDKQQQFVTLFNKYFQPGFILLSKEAFYEKEFLGFGEKHPLLDNFVGDFMAISISNKAIEYQKGQKPFKAHHAGYTKEELIVPLIILEKT